MLPPILLLSLNIIVVITIGITPVHPLLITPVGPLLEQRSQSTIHVQPVGVYLTEAAIAFGQRPDLMIQHTIVQTKECRSASVHLQQLGTLLRVFASAVMAVSAMSAAPATIGLLLLSITTRTSCTSTTMALSVRRSAPTLARPATLSVVSKNNI